MLIHIKFTCEKNKESIHFLDFKVKLSDGKISTDLCVKSVFRYQFLHYTLPHPDHTKRSVVFSQALRVSGISSDKSDILSIRKKMKSWFSVRRCPKDLIETEMKKDKLVVKE